jgi:hypothetical protein
MFMLIISKGQLKQNISLKTLQGKRDLSKIFNFGRDNFPGNVHTFDTNLLVVEYCW